MNFYELVKARAFIQNDQLNVILVIPTCNQYRYQLYTINKLPTPTKENIYSNIDSEYNFFLLELETNQYSSLKELNENIIQLDTTYVILDNLPFYTDTSNRCEGLLFFEKLIYKECQFNFLLFMQKQISGKN